MPRKLRVEYDGAMFHVMSRGDRREDIFLDDVDRQDFIKKLAEACQKTDLHVHASCLMRNHSHLVNVLRCGWRLRSEQFQEQMLQSMEGKLGQHHSGEL